MHNYKSLPPKPTGAMSDRTDATTGESSGKALAAMRQAMHAGEKGGDPDLAPDEHACGKCGDQFGNAGALATHAKACEGEQAGEREAAEGGNSEGSAYEPGDMLPSEIGVACERMSAADARATCEALGRESPEGERIQATASKALAAAHAGMDGQAYVAAFGECAHPDCGYGANGIDAAKCARHEGE